MTTRDILLRRLRFHTRTWAEHVVQVARTVDPEMIDERQILQSLDAEKRLYLLNLRTWCRRYHVDLRFVLSTLFQHYARMRQRQPVGYRSWGMPMAVLCGPTSRQVVEAAIAEKFPSGEQECSRASDWHWRTQGSALVFPRPVSTAQSGHVVDDVQQYIKRMRAQRQQFERQYGRFSQRPWRGRPQL